VTAPVFLPTAAAWRVRLRPNLAALIAESAAGPKVKALRAPGEK
jgi:hypothetical protein